MVMFASVNYLDSNTTLVKVKYAGTAGDVAWVRL